MATNKSLEQRKPRIYHEVFYKVNPDNPRAVELMREKADQWLANIPGVEEFRVGVPFETGRAVGARDYDLVLHMAFGSRDSMSSYMKHPDHMRWVDWVLNGWMVAGSVKSTPQERHEEFIRSILFGADRFQRKRDEAVDQRDVVWASEKVYDYEA